MNNVGKLLKFSKDIIGLVKEESVALRGLGLSFPEFDLKDVGKVVGQG